MQAECDMSRAHSTSHQLPPSALPFHLPPPRGLLVDEHLRVVGSQGTIYCLGDAAVTGDTPATALPPTAQVSKGRRAGSQCVLCTHNSPSARLHCTSAGSWLHKHAASCLQPIPPKLPPCPSACCPQVARQEGQYLAALLSKQRLAVVEPAAAGEQAASSGACVPQGSEDSILGRFLTCLNTVLRLCLPHLCHTHLPLLQVRVSTSCRCPGAPSPLATCTWARWPTWATPRGPWTCR